MFLKQPKAVSLVQAKKKRKSLKTERILSADEEDEEDEIPEGFHLQEESPHCLNMQRAEDFQAYLQATGVGIRKDAEGRRNRHEDRIRQSY